MIYLKVDGLSQYDKEMKEIGPIEISKKEKGLYNPYALRRNEITYELEPTGYVNEVLAEDKELKRKIRQRIK